MKNFPEVDNYKCCSLGEALATMSGAQTLLIRDLLEANDPTKEYKEVFISLGGMEKEMT